MQNLTSAFSVSGELGTADFCMVVSWGFAASRLVAGVSMAHLAGAGA